MNTGKNDTVIYGYGLDVSGAGIIYNNKPVTRISTELRIKCYDNGTGEKNARASFDPLGEPGIYADNGEFMTLSDVFDIEIDDGDKIKVTDNGAVARMFEKTCGWDEIEYDILICEITTDERIKISLPELEKVISNQPPETRRRPIRNLRFSVDSIKLANDPDDSAHARYIEDMKDLTGTPENKPEPVSELKFINITGNADFRKCDVEFTPGMTVETLINIVLREHSDEWGNISIEKGKDPLKVNREIIATCSYDHGMPGSCAGAYEDAKKLEIEKITAFKSWNKTSYSVLVKQ